MRTGLEGISNFIFMADDIKQADVILIPGGSKKALAVKASELYHQGYAPYILPSGGQNNKLQHHDTEYDFLKEELMKLGVPESAILKENHAANTFDNAVFSLQVLINDHVKHKKAILVCKSFHARRAYLTYKINFPKSTEFLVQPIVDDKNITKENWIQSGEKIKRVMSEVEKIGKYFEEHVHRLGE